MFNEHEIRLGALLGIWSPAVVPAGGALHIRFLQDLEFVSRVANNQGGGGGRASYATATLTQDLINTNVLYHLIAMLLVKLYFTAKFSSFQLPAVAGGVTVAGVVDALNVGITTVGSFASAEASAAEVRAGRAATAVVNHLTLITQNPTVHEVLARVFETWHDPDMNQAFPAYANQITMVKEWSLGTGAPGSTSIEVQCLAADLFVLRPNIEHYMLALIFGRGGGPEELGATFWGQTELSCYDDSQHGIWGMSYKYHERAIVINERNLIRVFDVCFDGYCGGNDARILRWQATDTEDFKRQTQNLTAPYSGPSMIVMALPRHKNVFETFPNPLVWHPYVPNASRIKAHPDKGGQPADLQRHCPFASYQGCEPIRALTHQVYSMYYGALGLNQWAQLNAQLDPGHLAYANETDPYVFSFHGHMAAILDGQREETQGSGHLGPNFVGVASVREGRGMLPRGMPTLAHLV
jgi:hypothetical protein